jgi:hypothetical protein
VVDYLLLALDNSQRQMEMSKPIPIFISIPKNEITVDALDMVSSQSDHKIEVHADCSTNTIYVVHI